MPCASDAGRRGVQEPSVPDGPPGLQGGGSDGWLCRGADGGWPRTGLPSPGGVDAAGTTRQTRRAARGPAPGRSPPDRRSPAETPSRPPRCCVGGVWSHAKHIVVIVNAPGGLTGARVSVRGDRLGRCRVWPRAQPCPGWEPALQARWPARHLHVTHHGDGGAAGPVIPLKGGARHLPAAPERGL